jgi:hypothetical protein
MNRQVWIVLVTMLIALALPLAGVILTLQSLTKREPQESGPCVSEALQNMLEGIADEKLAPEELRGSEARIELIADELNGEKVRIEGLLKSYGGIAIPTLESEAEIRLLVQIPGEHLEEFLVACRAGKEGGPVNDPSGGLLEVVIKRTNSQ